MTAALDVGRPSARAFTLEERRDIREACEAFAAAHHVEVGHCLQDDGESVWLWVKRADASASTGFTARSVDEAPAFVNARFATYLTLTRLTFPEARR